MHTYTHAYTRAYINTYTNIQMHVSDHRFLSLSCPSHCACITPSSTISSRSLVVCIIRVLVSHIPLQAIDSAPAAAAASSASSSSKDLLPPAPLRTKDGSETRLCFWVSPAHRHHPDRKLGTGATDQDHVRFWSVAPIVPLASDVYSAAMVLRCRSCVPSARCGCTGS
jgi:hypothetical protein